MDMLTTFEFVVTVSRAFGVFSFRVHKFSHASILLEAKTLTQSKVMLGVFATVQCLAILQTLKRSSDVYEPLPKRIVRLLNLIVFTLSGVIMYVSVLTKTTVLRFWLNELNKLCLLVDAIYGRLLFWNRIIVLGTFVNLVGTNSLSMILNWISVEELGFWEFSESVYEFVLLGVTGVFSCQFLIFMNAAGFVYKQANEALRVLRKRPELLRNKILKLKNLKAEDMFLKDYLDVLNSVYMSHAFVCIFWSFLSLVYVVVNEINSLTALPGTLHLFLWVFYLVFQMVMILAVCQATVLEAEKTANYVHELFLDDDDPEIKEEIEIFSLQLQHRKVEFNACGFFKMDFTLLYSMIGAVTTYIIILMQFQKEEPSPSEWLPKKIGNCSQLFHHYAAEDVYRCLNTSSCPA